VLGEFSNGQIAPPVTPVYDFNLFPTFFYAPFVSNNATLEELLIKVIMRNHVLQIVIKLAAEEIDY